MPGEQAIAEWKEIQGRIWCCEVCRSHQRMACNTKQQTAAPASSEMFSTGAF